MAWRRCKKGGKIRTIDFTNPGFGMSAVNGPRIEKKNVVLLAFDILGVLPMGNGNNS